MDSYSYTATQIKPILVKFLYQDHKFKVISIISVPLSAESERRTGKRDPEM